MHHRLTRAGSSVGPARTRIGRLAALIVAVFIGSLPCTPAAAMSVLPPTFEELVAESAQIVRGRVVEVSAVRTTTPDGSRVIRTRVTWELSRVLKGAPTTLRTLEFLGGTIGTERLVVPGMPAFAVGDEDYLFVEPQESTICPLLAAGHGRYRVRTDPATGRAYIARDNDAVLASADDVTLPLAAVAARRPPSVGLTPAQFEGHILATLERLGAPHETR